MIYRRLEPVLQEALSNNAAVALLGPRQVGKTTLALSFMPKEKVLYLDLENNLDKAKMVDFPSFYHENQDKLLILDEIQRVPEIFSTIRGIIDEQRRQGRRNGLFLFLGSASMDLLRQSGESLAGRIAYLELHPLNLLELNPSGSTGLNDLWLRGGFPDSLLAKNERYSLAWRTNFIRTYLERDIQQIGPRIPAETLGRLWTMLAHQQGSIINMSALARGIDVSVSTANRYLDLMVDLLLVRRLKPYAFNAGKRLVKMPKVYVRDSGIAHALLNIGDINSLLGHPVVGGSWEGFVIENLIAVSPSHFNFYFYRTAQGAEIDLVIEITHQQLWAIEIKRSSNPTVSKGFHIGADDIKAEKKFVVYAGADQFSMGSQIMAISLQDMMLMLSVML
ncbi:MAG: ATP-binding protein [Chitinophagaceae bacterium]|jgi:predicted AAA+ superfamily ATPase|nr:ATP-binding protein [Chitinophagaceae bacterium]